MKVKIGNLVGCHEAGALNRIANMALPFNTANRMREALLDITEALQTFEKDKINLLGEFCKKDDKGEFILNEQGGATFADGQYEKFNEEIAKVLHSEVDIRHLPFKRNQMLSSAVISANDLMLLEWMIPIEKDEWAETIEK